MAFYPSLLRRIIMPSYELLKGKQLLKHLNNYENHLSWSEEQLLEYQWEHLSVLLTHAYNNTSYYPRVWAEAGVKHPKDITNMSDFQALPVVSKDDIKQHYREFVSNQHHNNIKKSTGGSSGQPFHFELNLDSHTRREAVAWRGYGWLSAGLGERTLNLWGVDLTTSSSFKTIKNALFHRYYNRKVLNSFAMNQSNINEYLESINSYRPTAIVSYVNPLYELARFINQNQLTAWKPKTILTGAEPLHEYQRQEIEQAFGAPVYNTFGCREFMLIAAECPEHKNLHLNVDHLVVETIDEQGVVINGESGDLVITDLFNFGMPLIRYVNGDRATIKTTKCSCSNPLPIMSSVDGRKLDIIKTPSGGIIAGELFPHLFKDFLGVSRFQIVQKQLDKLIIKIIPNEEFSDNDKKKIATIIDTYSRGELELDFQLVSDIPLTVSGKHRITICEV